MSGVGVGSEGSEVGASVTMGVVLGVELGLTGVAEGGTVSGGFSAEDSFEERAPKSAFSSFKELSPN